MSNPPSHLRTDQPQVVLPEGESTERKQGVAEGSFPHPIAGLATMLRHLADGALVIHWGIPHSSSESQPRGEQLVRLDAQHSIDRGTAALDTTSALENPDESRAAVLVERARNLDSADGARRIQGMLREAPALIVVAWDDETADETAGPQGGEIPSNLAALSERAGLDYAGPVSATEPLRLFEMLAKIKDRDRPALVHVRARAPHASSETRASTAAPRRLSTHAFRQIASLELADRAADDPRVVVAAVATDAEFLEPWREMAYRAHEAGPSVGFALRWCAALASEGGRPFVFLPLDEVHGNFGVIRQEICIKRVPVALLVDPGAVGAADEPVSAASLAGIRQLPNVALLSPKNGDELRQMIRFSMAHDGPTVIWLPDVNEPQSRWNEGPAIALGRAEQLSTGEHVALVAWGPMVSAAEMAAHVLLQYGIESTVINARFAQPLDLETIAQASRGALCTVLVDDADVPGGVSSWVVDQLSRLGVAQPVAIVAPHARSLRQNPYQVHQQCALRIVDHCRWLVDPVNQASDAAVMPIVPARTPDLSTTRVWLSTPSLKVRDEYDEHRQVLAQQFSPFIEEWVRRYSKVGARDVYLWRWCLHGLDLTTLSCVPVEVRSDLCDTKLLAVMYGVMLDDIADQGGEEPFLRELEKIISGVGPRDFSQFSPSRQAYAEFTSDLWETFERRLQRSPCYREYEELLAYDHRQILNTMSYSCLVNRRPELLNVQEHDAYLPHNMQMMSFATMDLMNSPSFDRRELGKLREVIWHAQNMGRIGNLVSTWQREIADRDFTSGVFARALREGDLTLDDLRSASPAAIDSAVRAGGHEQYFLEKWESHRKSIQSMARSIRSVDIQALLVSLERLIHMELSSRGFK